MTKPPLKISAAALHASKKRDGPMCEKCTHLDAHRRGPAGCFKGHAVLEVTSCADYDDASRVRHEVGGLTGRRIAP